MAGRCHFICGSRWAQVIGRAIRYSEWVTFDESGYFAHLEQFAAVVMNFTHRPGVSP